MLAVEMAWLPLLGAVGRGHQLWPLSHGGTHFSGFPRRAGESQLTFRDGGALVRGNGVVRDSHGHDLPAQAGE